MNIQNLSTLKIHKLTQEQYDRELASGTLKENEIYLTPEEEIDLSPYATVEQLKSKADATHNHNDTYYTETEIDSKLAEINSSIAGKSDTNHEHDDKYYTEDEIDSKIDTLNTAISSKADSTHQHTGITDGDNSAIMQDYALLPMAGNGVLPTASSPSTSATIKINLGSRGNTWGTAYVNEVYIENAGDYLTEILKSKASDSAITSSIFSHNSSTSAHSDIRSLIDENTTAIDALETAVSNKMDKINPTGSGNVSIGRASGSTVGTNSIAVGNGSKATASNSIAIGSSTTASGENSVVIGIGATASGVKSVAIGDHNTASGEYATAMGCWTNAPGTAAIALGNGTTANGWGAMASGILTNAKGLGQHVFGSYNIPDSNTISEYYDTSDHLIIVGNGDVLSDDGVQSNAATLDWAGNAWFAGDVYVGSTSGTNKDSGSKMLATVAHTHTVSHTPAGSVSSSFSGKAVTSDTPSGTTSVASNTHTHKYTPSGIVSKPTFTGSAVTSGASSDTKSVYSITGVGSVPSLTASVTNCCLTLNFSAGSVPTRESVKVASSSHTHSVTASGEVSQPIFTGTEASTTSISGTTSVASSGHTHSVTASGSVASSFTGTAATLTTSSAK